MGKRLNVNNLSKEECEQILEVIQRDFELRQVDKLRLSKIEEDIQEEEEKTGILTKQQKFNQNCCIRCCETFGIIFNRKQTCRRCLYFVCKSCSQYNDDLKGYVCKACLKEDELKLKSFDWFYNNVSKKFKRFGSAKVVRSLYKYTGDQARRAHSEAELDEIKEESDDAVDNVVSADCESDSGYDPSFYSSLGQSGSFSSVKKPRPSLQGLFPDIRIHDEDGEELDNGIPPPPPEFRSTIPYHGSLDSLPHSTVTTGSMGALPQSPTTDVSQNNNNENVNDKVREKEKKDIYREAFENTRRVEETKFKLRFDHIVADLQKSLDSQSPSDLPSGYDNTSYGEVMVTYRGRIKELLVSLSQRLELAIESFDESTPSSALATTQKVKQIVSKLVEDRLGESLDLTSDEAVSDLSSLSDESGDQQKSFEDQIAQAVIARVLENYRKESGVHLRLDEAQDLMDGTYSSGSEEKMVDQTMSSTASEKNVQEHENSLGLEERKDSVTEAENENKDLDEVNHNEEIEEVMETHSVNENSKEEGVIDERTKLRKEFEELRHFALTVPPPRPLYEEVDMEEDVEVEEEALEQVHVDRSESQDEFASRFNTYDRIQDSHVALPDFEELDFEDSERFAHEIDPDLLSMNLAPIEEETEEELEEENKREPDSDDWRGNWIFKGGTELSPYSNIGHNRICEDLGDVYMTIPQPYLDVIPTVGNRDADELSDLSENDGHHSDSSDGLSDEESSFYAKTSEEIARITRKRHRSALTSASVQTDDSDMESTVSRGLNSSFSDSGVKSHSVSKENLNSTKESEKPQIKKLFEELIPSEDNDPKFEIPPDSTKVAEGEPAKFTCRVAGTQPIDVFWYRVLEEIEELEDSEKYEISKESNRQTITMFNLTMEDAGQYMCLAVNEKGRCCQYFILTVKKNTLDLKPPEFIKGIADTEVTEGQSVKFRCKVKGYPQPRIVWYKDGHLLKSSSNCRLEKFGNRDYLLAIDCATPEEDAEYTIVAKNIAGEVKSSAQLIVEPSFYRASSPENTPTPSPRQPISKTAASSLASPRQPKSPSSKKQHQNLTNLSQKVSMTKDSVATVAEEMLSSSLELSEITKTIEAMDRILADIECDIQSVSSDDIENNNGGVVIGDTSTFEALDNYLVMKEAASRVQQVTSATLDYLSRAENYIQSEKSDIDCLATSTPRSEKDQVFHLDNENNNFSQESSISAGMSHAENDSDTHKTELSFSFTPSVHSQKIPSTDQSQTQSRTSKRKEISDSHGAPSVTNDVSNETKTNLESQKQKERTSSTTSDISLPSPMEESSYGVSDISAERVDTDLESEHLLINTGPKRVDSQRYNRDFYVNNTPKAERRHWDVKTDYKHPEADVVNRDKHLSHTEQKIYLTAGNVFSLEDKVDGLQHEVKSAGSPQMSKLEDKVARTVAEVAQSEKQVESIEKSVNQLKTTNVITPRQIHAAGSSKAPQRSRAPNINEPIEPTILVGQTSEKDIPESRTEFNEDYGEGLPSVNRLKAMFGGPGSLKVDDSSLRRVHSITARSVPKEQLARLRKSGEGSTASTQSNVSSVSQSGDKSHHNPGRATALTTGQLIKETPQGPKQVYQSGDMTSPRQHSANVSKRSAPKTESAPSAPQLSAMKITVSSNKTGSQSAPSRQQSQPMKSNVTGKGPAPKPPNQNDQSKQFQPVRTNVIEHGHTSNPPSQLESGSSARSSASEDEDGRKSPKIRSGAISARAKFWEKRIQGGQPEEEYPDLLDN